MRDQLPFIVKRFIVQRLACHDTPAQVAKDVKADFPELGGELSRQRIAFYDPTTKAGAALDPALKSLFEETRVKFLKELDAIPVANKAVRLRILNRMAALAESRGQIPEVRATLEAAAKEVGGAFTNESKLEHSGQVEIAATSARERLFARLDDIRESSEALRGVGLPPSPAKPN